MDNGLNRQITLQIEGVSRDLSNPEDLPSIFAYLVAPGAVAGLLAKLPGKHEEKQDIIAEILNGLRPEQRAAVLAVADVIKLLEYSYGGFSTGPRRVINLIAGLANAEDKLTVFASPDFVREACTYRDYFFHWIEDFTTDQKARAMAIPELVYNLARSSHDLYKRLSGRTAQIVGVAKQFNPEQLTNMFAAEGTILGLVVHGGCSDGYNDRKIIREVIDFLSILDAEQKTRSFTTPKALGSLVTAICNLGHRSESADNKQEVENLVRLFADLSDDQLMKIADVYDFDSFTYHNISWRRNKDVDPAVNPEAVKNRVVELRRTKPLSLIV